MKTQKDEVHRVSGLVNMQRCSESSAPGEGMAAPVLSPHVSLPSGSSELDPFITNR